MKNTNRKDFHDRQEVGTQVTISYSGVKTKFTNILHNNKSLWEMCECVIGLDLQGYWDYNLECGEKGNRKYHREEKRLMNLCEIKINPKKSNK